MVSLLLFIVAATASADEPDGGTTATTSGADAQAEDVGTLCPATAAGLMKSVEATFAAWEETNKDAYLAGRDRVFTQLDCMTELLTPTLAADVHAVMALDAYMTRRPDDMNAALRAYAATRSDLPLADRLKLPPPLAVAAADAVAQVAQPEEPLPESVSFWVDGTPATAWASTRPSILQATAADASSRVWTERVPLGGPLPQHPAWTSKEALLAKARAKRRNTIWWTSTGAGALASAGLWWAALSARSEFNGYADTVAASGPLADSRRTEVEATAQRANQLGVAAQILSGTTLGLGVIAFTRSF